MQAESSGRTKTSVEGTKCMGFEIELNVTKLLLALLPPSPPPPPPKKIIIIILLSGLLDLLFF